MLILKTTTNGWNVPRLVKLLETNDAAVERALLLIYRNQTPDEQESGETKYDNNKGFRSCDAAWGARYANYVLNIAPGKGYKEGKRLAPGMLKFLRHKNRFGVMRIAHYHRQILEEIQRKAGR